MMFVLSIKEKNIYFLISDMVLTQRCHFRKNNIAITFYVVILSLDIEDVFK